MLLWQAYTALAALDDDGDRQLSGKELHGLALWHDANGNGVSEPGEVRGLATWGIVAVACDYRIDEDHPDRIAYSPRGVTFRDGRTRPTFDVILHPRPKTGWTGQIPAFRSALSVQIDAARPPMSQGA